MKAQNLKTNRTQGRQRGFTLIELMVAMVLSLFLIGGVLLMYSSTKAAYNDADRLSRLQENVRFASDYMVRDVRNAGFRDQLTLTFFEQVAVQSGVAKIQVRDDNTEELIIRYAGRGHCQGPYSEDDENAYGVVENRYYFDPASDEGDLICSGAALDANGDGDPTNDGITDPSSDFVLSAADGGIALVSGLTDIDFEFLMADGTTESGPHTCTEPAAAIAASDRCIGVRIGMEFEGLRGDSGDFQERFVELTSTFRNSAITQIYASCSKLESQAGLDDGTWCD